MTTDQVLAILKDRGLRVIWSEGELRVRGSRNEVTPALLDVLRLHKPELLARLRPKPWRVVLYAGPDANESPVECVLVECEADERHVQVRKLAREHRGRAVAVEGARRKEDGSTEWVRTLWLCWPAHDQKPDEAPADDS